MAQNPVSKRESPALPIYKERNAETKRDVFLEGHKKKGGKTPMNDACPPFSLINEWMGSP